MSSVPHDPTQPSAPVMLPYRRPAPVTIAGLLMLFGALLGLSSAIALFAAAGTVVSRFRDNAEGIDVSSRTIDDVAAVIRGAFIGLGVLDVLLAIAMALLAMGVLRGRNGARIGTLVVIAIALCTGLGSASYTALGRGADWTVNVGDANEQRAAEVGQAYSDSVPGWLVGATAGLNDLQALSYIAVAVLLLLPVSNAYFRRRSAASRGSASSAPPPPAAPPPSSSEPPVSGPPPSANPHLPPTSSPPPDTSPPGPPLTYPPPSPPGPPGPTGPPGSTGPTGPAGGGPTM